LNASISASIRNCGADHQRTLAGLAGRRLRAQRGAKIIVALRSTAVQHEPRARDIRPAD